jgi:hypothetical protein
VHEAVAEHYDRVGIRERPHPAPALERKGVSMKSPTNISCVIQIPNVKVGNASNGQRMRTLAAIGL